MRAGVAPLTLTLFPFRVETEGLVSRDRVQELPLPAGDGRGEGRPGTPR
jgi:hypothetical protein